MRIDLDRWEEIFITITRNKTRSLLTAFGVFWGIFMLVALMGGGQGLQDMMSANFKGFATNSVFFGSNKTSEAYKGFRKGRYWDMEFNDVERIRQAVPEVEVITPNISRWGSTAIFGDKKSSCAVRGLQPDYEKIEAQNTPGKAPWPACWSAWSPQIRGRSLWMERTPPAGAPRTGENGVQNSRRSFRMPVGR